MIIVLLRLKLSITKVKILLKIILLQNLLILIPYKLYPPIILGTPFINVIYPFTRMNAKGFSATYDDRDISYTFITNPISRDINALINMKQKHFDSLHLELFSMNIFNTLKSTKVQEKIKLIFEHIAVDIYVDHPSAFWNHGPSLGNHGLRQGKL
ncbi:hypothetical protein H5410_004787 [Solanum commersonii]|uniref:Uncharacterized protein n=1 Tax=Solanum commersonii TaxID=4109 RepID=A0A9J6A4U5_SOLCO|nr:hypothetical protein H5410_004787 [Solanum commersonii]